jgi:hypothetical protein
MPFTFSHPAIVLPLKKLTGQTFSLTGLVIGSIAPDFEYFIRMSVLMRYSHYVAGILWFDLPVALLLTFVYHQIVRDQLLSCLPEILNCKLSAFKHFDWISYFKHNWIMVLVSLIIGIASHLFWDDFTHPFGYFVLQSVWLKKVIIISKIQIPVYRIIQHLSSLAGGVVVIFAIFSLKDGRAEQSKQKLRYWICVSAITGLILTIRFFTSESPLHYGDIIVTAMAGFLIGLIATPLLFVKTRGKEL